MDLRHSLSFAMFALIGCRGDEGRAPPENAGLPVHDCGTFGAPPAAPDATFHRGSLRIVLEDRSGDRALATLRADWTFAMDDGWPVPQTGCIDVVDVDKNLSVQPSLHVLRFGSEQRSAIVRVDVGATVFGPARIRDGTRLNYPEAWFSWSVSARATSVDYSIDEPSTRRELRPAWDNVELVDDLQYVGIQQVDRPTQ
jgi:hypothetical protein